MIFSLIFFKMVMNDNHPSNNNSPHNYHNRIVEDEVHQPLTIDVKVFLMHMTVYETRKSNLLKILELYPSRKEFCEKLGIEYNHLNQYLGKNSKKNIGDKFAEKVTSAHNLPLGWLDHLQDIEIIKNVISNQNTTKLVANNDDIASDLNNHSRRHSISTGKIIAINKTLKMSKGEDLAVINKVDVVHNLDIPSGLDNPVAYLIKGTGFSKPYRNGYAIVCEFSSEPIPGEEVIIFCNDDKIFVGEFLREDDLLVYLELVDGNVDRILKENIIRKSPIKLFVSPSHLK